MIQTTYFMNRNYNMNLLWCFILQVPSYHAPPSPNPKFIDHGKAHTFFI